MDLQLGLGISSSSSSSSTDENVYGIGIGIQNQMQMGGSTSNYINLGDSDNHFFHDQTCDWMKIDRRTPPTTLSLLVWDENHEDHHTETNSIEYNKDGNGDVGWPPISARRKRMYNQNRGGGGGSGERMTENWVVVENGGGDNGIGRNSSFVKVKMEGEGIGRKVDISLHDSLQSLLQTLVVMFGKCEESVYSYKLVYQDGVGFWKLAEEDSWGILIQTACRLRLMRNN